MPFVPMSDLLSDAYANIYAVPSFCVWNAESMIVVLDAAERLRAPVILMGGPAEFNLLAPRDMAAVARAVMSRYTVRAALHLDHGDTLGVVEDCMAAGYTSVMLDFSSRPYDENAAGLRRTVELARPRGVTVEGELGLVGKADDATVEGGEGNSLTDPAQAARFVADTGIDALAVAIGNAHGSYTRLPRLDFDRLAAIRASVGIPLVLHGGSGTPPDDLRRAISLGIAKVNVATESIVAVRESLRSQWDAGRNLWMPIAMGEAMAQMPPVVERWIRLTGAEGKA